MKSSRHKSHTVHPSRPVRDPSTKTARQFSALLAVAILGTALLLPWPGALEAATSRESQPGGFTGLYETASEAVVGIECRLGREQYVGSGTIVDPSGLVLTSITVVPPGSRSVRVYLRGGRRHDAEVLTTVEEKEFSLLRIRQSGTYPSLLLGDSDAVRLGQSSVSLGNAFLSIVRDDQVTITAGNVSGLYRLTEKRADSKYVGPVIETTTMVNDFMDGGPLLDSGGRVIGILSLNYSRQRFLGAAIPINSLKPLFGEYRRWRSDRREPNPVFLGLEIFERGGGDSERRAVVVSKAFVSSPAAKAGIPSGCRLLEIAGQEIRSLSDYEAALKKVTPGELLEVKFAPLSVSSDSDEGEDTAGEITMPPSRSVSLQPWFAF